ncbi:MAG: GerW family sporulation protein [Firmicutes bacterium]|nr:GerW family sporulation protein [Bacillota bacterium]
MPEHPIATLMKTAMENIRQMVNVGTVVGDAVETPDGSVIVPVSRVSFGFAAGGGEYEIGGGNSRGGAGGGGGGEEGPLPFAGGSGGGVTVQPVGFLVVGQGNVRLLPVDRSAVYDRLIDMAPQVIDQVWSLAQGGAGRLRGRARQEGERGERGGNESGRYRPA